MNLWWNCVRLCEQLLLWISGEQRVYPLVYVMCMCAHQAQGLCHTILKVVCSASLNNPFLNVAILIYSQVCEEDGWIGTVRFDILHGVPFVDTQLAGWDSALVVADPGQEQAAWVVVVAASHLASFVERLEGWPEGRQLKARRFFTWANVTGRNEKCRKEFGLIKSKSYVRVKIKRMDVWRMNKNMWELNNRA